MQDIEKRVIGKVMWRLIPFLIVCYFVAYLDRVNANRLLNNDRRHPIPATRRQVRHRAPSPKYFTPSFKGCARFGSASPSCT